MSPSSSYGTTHRAIVREIPAIGGGVIVEIPALAQAAAWGPIPTAVPDLAPGEQVLVTQLGVRRDDKAVVGRLPGRAPTIAEIDGLTEALAARALTVDLDALAAELRAADDELALADAALSGRLDTAETTLTDHSGRITTLEGHSHDQSGSYAWGGAVDITDKTPGSATTETSLFQHVFTVPADAVGQRAYCEMWLNSYNSTGGTPTVGTYTAQSIIKGYLSDTATGTDLHIADFLFELPALMMANNHRPRAQTTICFLVPYTLTAGVQYKWLVTARKDPNLTGSMTFQTVRSHIMLVTPAA